MWRWPGAGAPRLSLGKDALAGRGRVGVVLLETPDVAHEKFSGGETTTHKTNAIVDSGL